MADLLEYKCPNCGGAISFDPDTQNVKCPYCDTEFAVETLKSYDAELSGQQTEDDMKWGETAGTEWSDAVASGMTAYVCESCGGEILAGENTVADSCPFCGNNVIVSKNVSGLLKPDYVLPFQKDKKDALAALENHLKNKKLLPKVFSSEQHMEEIKGIYVPFWLYTAEAEADMVAKATKTRMELNGKAQQQVVDHYAVVRGGFMDFEHVPVDGSKDIDNDLMESIEPFDFSAVKEFQTAYLTGFFADKYDVSAEESRERANERIKASAEIALKNTATGYDSVTVESSSVRLKNGKVSYVLYPVWLLNTSWNGQMYHFAMNGQTGKFAGNLPEDKGNSRKTFAKVSVLSALVILVLGMFLGAMMGMLFSPMTPVLILVAAVVLGLVVGSLYTKSLKSDLTSVYAHDDVTVYADTTKLNLTNQKDIRLYSSAVPTAGAANRTVGMGGAGMAQPGMGNPFGGMSGASHPGGVSNRSARMGGPAGGMNHTGFGGGSPMGGPRMGGHGPGGFGGGHGSGGPGGFGGGHGPGGPGGHHR